MDQFNFSPRRYCTVQCVFIKTRGVNPEGLGVATTQIFGVGGSWGSQEGRGENSLPKSSCKWAIFPWEIEFL